MTDGVLTTCHTQYNSDSSICIFLFYRTTLQVFVTYLTGALYVLYMCTLLHNYCTPHIIKENYENFLILRCSYILLSQVYCVWQVVKTPTIIFNNPVFYGQK